MTSQADSDKASSDVSARMLKIPRSTTVGDGVSASTRQTPPRPEKENNDVFVLVDVNEERHSPKLSRKEKRHSFRFVKQDEDALHDALSGVQRQSSSSLLEVHQPVGPRRRTSPNNSAKNDDQGSPLKEEENVGEKKKKKKSKKKTSKYSLSDGEISSGSVGDSDAALSDDAGTRKHHHSKNKSSADDASPGTHLSLSLPEGLDQAASPAPSPEGEGKEKKKKKKDKKSKKDKKDKKPKSSDTQPDFVTVEDIQAGGRRNTAFCRLSGSWGDILSSHDVPTLDLSLDGNKEPDEHPVSSHHRRQSSYNGMNNTPSAFVLAPEVKQTPIGEDGRHDSFKQGGRHKRQSSIDSCIPPLKPVPLLEDVAEDPRSAHRKSSSISVLSPPISEAADPPPNVPPSLPEDRMISYRNEAMPLSQFILEGVAANARLTLARRIQEERQLRKVKSGTHINAALSKDACHPDAKDKQGEDNQDVFDEFDEFDDDDISSFSTCGSDSEVGFMSPPTVKFPKSKGHYRTHSVDSADDTLTNVLEEMNQGKQGDGLSGVKGTSSKANGGVKPEMDAKAKAIQFDVTLRQILLSSDSERKVRNEMESLVLTHNELIPTKGMIERLMIIFNEPLSLYTGTHLSLIDMRSKCDSIRNRLMRLMLFWARCARELPYDLDGLKAFCTFICQRIPFEHKKFVTECSRRLYTRMLPMFSMKSDPSAVSDAFDHVRAFLSTKTQPLEWTLPDEILADETPVDLEHIRTFTEEGFADPFVTNAFCDIVMADAESSMVSASPDTNASFRRSTTSASLGSSQDPPRLQDLSSSSRRSFLRFFRTDKTIPSSSSNSNMRNYSPANPLPSKADLPTPKVPTTTHNDLAYLFSQESNADTKENNAQIRMERLKVLLDMFDKSEHLLFPQHLELFWKMCPFSKTLVKGKTTLYFSFVGKDGVHAAQVHLGVPESDIICAANVLIVLGVLVNYTSVVDNKASGFPVHAPAMGPNSTDLFYFSAKPPMGPAHVGYFPEVELKSPLNSTHIVFTDIPAVEVARQLTIVEHDLLRKIRVRELQNVAWQHEDAERLSPNVLAFSAHSDKISTWVASEIVLTRTAAQRAAVIAHFLDVAKHCKHLNNFNGLVEIFVGLQHPSIKRLKSTWMALSRRANQRYEKLFPLTTAARNYSGYREVFNSCQKPAIPYLACILCDLVLLDEGIKAGHVARGSFPERKVLARVYTDLMECKSVPYPLKAIPDLQQFLRTGLLVVSSHSLMKFSKDCET